MSDTLFLGGAKLRDYAKIFSEKEFQLSEDSPNSVGEAIETIRDWLGAAPPWLIMQDIIDDVSSLFFRSPRPYQRRVLVVTDDFFKALQAGRGKKKSVPPLSAADIEPIIGRISSRFPLGSFLFVFVTSQSNLYESEAARLYRSGVDLVLLQYQVSNPTPVGRRFVAGAIEQRLASVQRAREVRSREFIQSTLRFTLAFVAIPFAYVSIQLFTNWFWPISWRLLSNSEIGRYLRILGAEWYFLLMVLVVLVSVLLSKYSLSAYARRTAALVIVTLAALSILGFVLCVSIG